MNEPTTFALAIACGAGGSFVDVSEWVLFDNGGVERRWGRQSAFDDVRPGEFAFTLDNSDGRFTPGNVLSALGVPLREGMRVSWQLNGRLVAGRIRAFAILFADVANAKTSRVRVTCDDMLGNASRRQLVSPLTSAMVLGSTPYLYWPFNDAEGSVVAEEKSGRKQPPFGAFRSTDVFGEDGFAALGTDSQLRCSPAVGESVPSAPAIFSSLPAVPGSFATIDYAPGSMGSWGVWVTPIDENSECQITVSVNGLAFAPLTFGLKFNFGPKFFMDNGATADYFSDVPATFGVPRYLQVVVTYTGSTSITYAFYINGVFQTSRAYVPFSGPAGLSTNYARTPSKVGLFNGNGSALIAHLSHTAHPVSEWLFNRGTEASALEMLDQAMPDVTLGALPSALSGAAVIPPDGGSALSALNEVMKTEQGHIYSSVSGSLLAPVEVLAVRERDRPVAADRVFVTTKDILGAPDIRRNISDAVSLVAVTGGGRTVSASLPEAGNFVGSASAGESVLLIDGIDLLAWGEDRLLRGLPNGFEVQRVSVDARATDEDRWLDLLSLLPGDRVRISGLPAAQLGLSSWDGWLLGAEESHDRERNLFTFYLQPVLPDQAVCDTSRLMAGGNVSLPSNINNAVTSFSVASVDGLLTTTETPFTLLVDSEQMTVTAVSSASSPQTVTVVRGVNGTTAAAHTTTSTVEVTPASLYAF